MMMHCVVLRERGARYMRRGILRQGVLFAGAAAAQEGGGGPAVGAGEPCRVWYPVARWACRQAVCGTVVLQARWVMFGTLTSRMAAHARAGAVEGDPRRLPGQR
eukprot:3356532-Rhodomonas_salina.4